MVADHIHALAFQGQNEFKSTDIFLNRAHWKGTYYSKMELSVMYIKLVLLDQLGSNVFNSSDVLPSTWSQCCIFSKAVKDAAWRFFVPPNLIVQTKISLSLVQKELNAWCGLALFSQLCCTMSYMKLASALSVLLFNNNIHVLKP